MKEIEIPEGYEARIEGNKVILERKESEDERINRAIFKALSKKAARDVLLAERIQVSDALAYLERQKERGPLSKDEEYTLARIIEYLEDNDCPSIWKDLLHDIYSLPYRKDQQPAEWSEEDEKLLNYAISMTDDAQVKGFLKSLRPQPKGEIYKSAKHDLAIRFMNYLDENRPDGKMSLSSGECEDIDKAFKENDWAKILRYAEKYSPSWKPSEEQMKRFKNVLITDRGIWGIETKRAMESLYADLEKL